MRVCGVSNTHFLETQPPSPSVSQKIVDTIAVAILIISKLNEAAGATAKSYLSLDPALTEEPLSELGFLGSWILFHIIQRPRKKFSHLVSLYIVVKRTGRLEVDCRYITDIREAVLWTSIRHIDLTRRLCHGYYPVIESRKTPRPRQECYSVAHYFCTGSIGIVRTQELKLR
jgi:hypothetical protein